MLGDPQQHERIDYPDDCQNTIRDTQTIYSIDQVHQWRNADNCGNGPRHFENTEDPAALLVR